MKRKVASPDLGVGMYVVELDRPWIEAPFESPFQIEGFTVRTDEELEKVQSICRYVYIDPDLGTPAKRHLVDGDQHADASKVVTSMPSESWSAEVYKDQVTLQEEVPAAQAVLDDTESLYEKIISDLGADSQSDAPAVRKVVTGLVGSVVRNPEALSWLVSLKQKDEGMYVHAISTAVLALTVGRFLGLPKDRLQVLGTSALLQDIGKTAVPTEILNKESSLTEDERQSIQEHVDASVDMLEKSRNFDIEVIHTVRLHHERFDGSGYPQKLSKGQIPLLASLCGIADCYQAGISARPYRDAKTSFQVLMELYAERDIAFPAGIIEQFIQCVGIFPIGGFVKLNTMEIGIIVRRNQIQQLKPQVMILIDANGNRIEDPQTVDLTTQYLGSGQMSRLVSTVVDPAHYNLDPSEFFL